jgi:Na+(H+)/acetate symporter ActP
MPSNEIRRVVVAGGAGFIGGNLVRTQPWEWDNNNFFHYWQFGTVVLVAPYLTSLLDRPGGRVRNLSGALLVVAMTLVIVVFAVVFLGGLALTWPDVPWTTLLIVTIVVNGLLPIVAYPWCMTVWMGLHHAIVTTNRHETERPR